MPSGPDKSFLYIGLTHPQSGHALGELLCFFWIHGKRSHSRSLAEHAGNLKGAPNPNLRLRNFFNREPREIREKSRPVPPKLSRIWRISRFTLLSILARDLMFHNSCGFFRVCIR